MKRKIVIYIVVILIVIGFIVYLNLIQYKVSSIKSNYTNQTCKIKGNYCIYNNIPNGSKYALPEEIIPEDNRHKEACEIKENNSEGCPYATDLAVEKFICEYIGKKLVPIKYFDEVCNNLTSDCVAAVRRRAFFCGGDFYYIEEFSEESGPKYYGPFMLGFDLEPFT